jgi:hypothetical protein
MHADVIMAYGLSWKWATAPMELWAEDERGRKVGPPTTLQVRALVSAEPEGTDGLAILSPDAVTEREAFGALMAGPTLSLDGQWVAQAPHLEDALKLAGEVLAQGRQRGLSWGWPQDRIALQGVVERASEKLARGDL